MKAFRPKLRRHPPRSLVFILLNPMMTSSQVSLSRLTTSRMMQKLVRGLSTE
jgi:hypothetical protein